MTTEQPEQPFVTEHRTFDKGTMGRPLCSGTIPSATGLLLSNQSPNFMGERSGSDRPRTAAPTGSDQLFSGPSRLHVKSRAEAV